jgi:hypothetical protein
LAPLFLQALLRLALLLLGVVFLEGVAPPLDHVAKPVALRRREHGGNLVLQVFQHLLGLVGGVPAQAAQILGRLVDEGSDRGALVRRERRPDLVGEALHQLRSKLFRRRRAALSLLHRPWPRLLLAKLLLLLQLLAEHSDELRKLLLLHLPLLLLQLVLRLLELAFVLHLLHVTLRDNRHRDSARHGASQKDPDERQNDYDYL